MLCSQFNTNLVLSLWTKTCKKKWEKSYTKLPQLLQLNFLAKFLTERKYLVNILILRGRNIFRCFIKSINPEIHNKSPGNDDLTAEFHKHFLNELAPVLFFVYDSLGKLGTMSVNSRTGISIIFYIKKVIKKIQNYRPIST